MLHPRHDAITVILDKGQALLVDIKSFSESVRGGLKSHMVWLVIDPVAPGSKRIECEDPLQAVPHFPPAERQTVTSLPPFAFPRAPAACALHTS